MFLSKISSCLGILTSTLRGGSYPPTPCILPLTVNRFRPHKRAGLERAGPVLFQISQDPVERVFCEPFVIVFVDLHHRRGATGGKTFDRREGKESVGGRLT